MRPILCPADGAAESGTGASTFGCWWWAISKGLGSERGIAWRAADSLALREFLGLKLSESPPDHSTLSRTRRLIDVQTHAAVFDWVLQRVGEADC